MPIRTFHIVASACRGVATWKRSVGNQTIGLNLPIPGCRGQPPNFFREQCGLFPCCIAVTGNRQSVLASVTCEHGADSFLWPVQKAETSLTRRLGLKDSLPSTLLCQEGQRLFRASSSCAALTSPALASPRWTREKLVGSSDLRSGICWLTRLLPSCCVLRGGICSCHVQSIYAILDDFFRGVVVMSAPEEDEDSR